MKEWLTSLSNALTFTSSAEHKALLSLVIVGTLLALRFAAIRAVNKWTDDIPRRYRWRRGISYVAAALGLLLVGRVWFQGVQSLATLLGLVSAGLLIALQDFVLNLAGWVFITLRAPFRVGDRVEIAGIKGDVIDMRIFAFSLMETGNWVDADQSTGRIIHMPNGKIFREPLANYTQGFEYIWHEIPVLVTFESDWEGIFCSVCFVIFKMKTPAQILPLCAETLRKN